MMRLMYLLLSTMLMLGWQGINCIAQIYDPVQWSFSNEHLDDDQYLLIFQAEIEPGWAVYSQYLENDLGPVATSVNYNSDDHFVLIDEAQEEGHKKEGYDALFDMNVVKYTDEFVIKQKIRLKEDKTIRGYVNFMTCDDTKCLPPKDVDFSFTLDGSKGGSKDTGSNDASAAADDFEDIPVVINFDDDFSTEDDSGLVNPAVWSASFEKNARSKVIFKVDIDEGWYIYGQEIEGDGPIPTSFIIGGRKKILEVEATKSTEEPDVFFDGIVIKKIKEEATFILPVGGQTVIEGEIEYMSCNAETCTFPAPIPFRIDPASASVLLGDEVPLKEGEEISDAKFAIQPSNIDDPVGSCGPVPEVKGKGIWSIFVLGFLGGLFALLTPCVFPMIPLTVSFFTKGSEDRTKGIQRASLYGVFILLVYLLLSVPFHLLDSVNPGILNEISTNVALNIFFFAVFVFFAFSFFGYYELTVPSRWTNKVSAAEGVGGAIGIFFMALTLALVSFSCTGPILGALLAGAITSDGGAMQLSAGMGGFGLALALPFALFAAFPTWLTSLPKSGGWLNTVKVTLGFVELALAFKFLSNADLVKRWGLLKIEPFLIIWVLISLGLAAYLLGKIKFPHDGILKKLSPLRVSTGVLAVAFAIYLMSGFRVNQDTGTFTSLGLLSGLAPPTGYSWLRPNECPNNLDCFKDLEKGVAHAQKEGKPIILDFTGHACVNCRKMEEHVWPKNPIIGKLKQDFTLVSLYVDEKITLPDEEQKVVKKKSGGTQRLRTYGNKWEYFQSEYFNNNSQPFYVILSPDGELLNHPVGYTPDVDEFAAFLNCGLEAFETWKKESGKLGMVQ